MNNQNPYSGIAIIVSLVFIASAVLSGWASILAIRDRSRKTA